MGTEYLELRTDTKRLLDRLGQPEFQYREYDEAPIASTDRWPLFEVVERQLRHSPLRMQATREDHIEAPDPAETPDTGKDVHRLIARIARGRGA